MKRLIRISHNYGGIKNVPILKPDEVYCVICKQIVKRKNLDRHDNGIKHERKLHRTFYKNKQK